MSIKNITQKNLIIDSEFLLDKSILELGELIPNSIKSINRIYYSLEHTHNQIVKNEITKEEFEKNPKYNYHFYNDEIEGNYSSLNYSEFETDFSFNDWSYDFQIIVIEQILDDLLNSIKTEIVNSKTDTQSKIFFEELLRLIDGSNFFLTEFSQNQNCNKIQKYASESFLEFNKFLTKDLQSKYQNIFPELFEKFFLSHKSKIKSFDFEKNIFKSIDAQNWFFASLEEMIATPSKRGFGAVISALYRNLDCKNNIFVDTITQVDYVKYLNSKYEKTMRTDNLSQHYKYEPKVKILIKEYLSNKPE